MREENGRLQRQLKCKHEDGQQKNTLFSIKPKQEDIKAKLEYAVLKRTEASTSSKDLNISTLLMQEVVNPANQAHNNSNILNSYKQLKNLDITRRLRKKSLLDATSFKDLKQDKREKLHKTSSLQHLLKLAKNVLRSRCGNSLVNRDASSARNCPPIPAGKKGLGGRKKHPTEVSLKILGRSGSSRKTSIEVKQGGSRKVLMTFRKVANVKKSTQIDARIVNLNVV